MTDYTQSCFENLKLKDRHGPNIVGSMTTQGYSLWQQKIVRTSDGTIHMVGAANWSHYRSSDNGLSWASVQIGAYSGYPALAKDSKDNLHSTIKDSGSALRYCKGTVNKITIPWTWSWGSIQYLDTSYNEPDIYVDIRDFIHISSGLNTWNHTRWYYSINGGTSWSSMVFYQPVYYHRQTITGDSYGNIYYLTGQVDAYQIRICKITYNPTTSSFQVGSWYATGFTGFVPFFKCLSDNHLCMFYQYGGNMYFRKSTYPCSYDQWNAGVAVGATQTGQGFTNWEGTILELYAKRLIAVYNDSTGRLGYKVSNDGGATWSSSFYLLAVTGTNTYPIGQEETNNIYRDIIWTTGTASPYTFYHKAFQPGMYYPSSSKNCGENEILSDKIADPTWLLLRETMEDTLFYEGSEKLYSPGSVSAFDYFNPKMARTTDNTIHYVFRSGGNAYHLYSRNEGATWNSVLIANYSTLSYRTLLIADNNDNLIMVTYWGATVCRRATVNKGVSPWTWSWTTSDTSIGGMYQHPIHIICDTLGYLHALSFNSESSNTMFWYRSTNGGVSWTTTQLNGYPSGNALGSLCSDSKGNIYVQCSSNNIQKITYSQGKWNVGPIQSIGGSDISSGILFSTPNDVIHIAYVFGSNIRYKRTYSPFDINTWMPYSSITTAGSYVTKICPVILSPNIIRIYYFTSGSPSTVKYRESRDCGLTWGSEVSRNISSSTFTDVATLLKSVNDRNGIVYWNSASSLVYLPINASALSTLNTFLRQFDQTIRSFDFVSRGTGFILEVLSSYDILPKNFSKMMSDLIFLRGSIFKKGSIMNVVSANGATFSNNTQKKVIRTSDGTIHVLITTTSALTHYLSRTNGSSWSSTTVESTGAVGSITSDQQDNLYIAYMRSYNIYFKKATVLKGTPWTWTWGTEKLVQASADAYNPDIMVDGNGYFHVAFYRSDNASGYNRCVDGVGNSWTGYTIGGVSNASVLSISRDTLNNFFIVGSGYYVSEPLKCWKGIYNGGTSWTISQGTNISSRNMQPTSSTKFHCLQMLPNNKIIEAYFMAAGTLYFRKSTNPSSLSAWDAEVAIYTVSNTVYSDSVSIMVFDNNWIRIYYIRQSDGKVYYVESTNGGVSFGSEKGEYTTVGNNRFVNCSKPSTGKSRDLVWRNGTADPYVIKYLSYHQFEEDESNPNFGKNILHNIIMNDVLSKIWSIFCFPIQEIHLLDIISSIYSKPIEEISIFEDLSRPILFPFFTEVLRIEYEIMNKVKKAIFEQKRRRIVDQEG